MTQRPKGRSQFLDKGNVVNTNEIAIQVSCVLLCFFLVKISNYLTSMFVPNLESHYPQIDSIQNRKAKKLNSFLDGS